MSSTPQTLAPLVRARQLAHTACAGSFLVLNTIACLAVALTASPWQGSKRAFGVWLHRWARNNVWGGSFEIEVEGLEQLARPAILACNHAAGFDIMLLAALVRPPLFFVSRLENRRAPVIGLVLHLGGHVLVERGRGRANETALEAAAECLHGQGVVVFFPEGSRSRDGRVHAFRSGAFRLAARTGYPLIPVAIAGTRHVHPLGTLELRPCRIAVRFLPPVQVPAEDPAAFDLREATRAAVERACSELEPRTGPTL